MKTRGITFEHTFFTVRIELDHSRDVAIAEITWAKSGDSRLVEVEIEEIVPETEHPYYFRRDRDLFAVFPSALLVVPTTKPFKPSSVVHMYAYQFGDKSIVVRYNQNTREVKIYAFRVINKLKA